MCGCPSDLSRVASICSLRLCSKWPITLVCKWAHSWIHSHWIGWVTSVSKHQHVVFIVTTSVSVFCCTFFVFFPKKNMLGEVKLCLRGFIIGVLPTVTIMLEESLMGFLPCDLPSCDSQMESELDIVNLTLSLQCGWLKISVVSIVGCYTCERLMFVWGALNKQGLLLNVFFYFIVW